MSDLPADDCCEHCRLRDDEKVPGGYACCKHCSYKDGRCVDLSDDYLSHSSRCPFSGCLPGRQQATS